MASRDVWGAIFHIKPHYGLSFFLAVEKIKDACKHVETQRGLDMQKDSGRVEDELDEMSAHDEDVDYGDTDTDVDVDSDDPGTTMGKRHIGSKIAIAVLSVVAVASIAIAVLFATGIISLPAPAEGGATLGQADGRSMEEIKDDLNQQVEDSMMTISVSPTLWLDTEGDGVYANFENVSDNKFDQRFIVMQDGKVVYESGVVSPGQVVKTFDCAALTEGEATVRIIRADEDGEQYGNATEVVVTVQDDEGGTHFSQPTVLE